MTPRAPSTTSRRILLAVGLAHARYGRAPSWTEVVRVVGLQHEPRARFVERMRTLRKRGLVTWVDDKPGTPRLTPAGYRAALGKGVR